MNKIKKKICIYGTGGFGREVLCCLKDLSSSHVQEKYYFMVDDQEFQDSKIMGVEVIRRSIFDSSEYAVVVAIGDPKLRKGVVDSLPLDTTFATVVHPSAIISEWVELGVGNIITAGVILTCNIKIGNHAHLNLHSSIGHDAVIGDYFTAAPGSRVSGNCRIGDGVYLGTNSAIRQEISICDNVTIGMGATVIKNINKDGVYVGNPARRLER